MLELKIVGFFFFHFDCFFMFSSLNPVLRSSDLYWDDGLDPLLAQVAVGRDAAVMGGSRQQEDGAQHAVSTWNGAETEQDQDPLLERAPGPQKTHRSLVVLHRYWRRLCTQDFTTTRRALNY